MGQGIENFTEKLVSGLGLEAKLWLTETWCLDTLEEGTCAGVGAGA